MLQRRRQRPAGVEYVITPHALFYHLHIRNLPVHPFELFAVFLLYRWVSGSAVELAAARTRLAACQKGLRCEGAVRTLGWTEDCDVADQKRTLPYSGETLDTAHGYAIQ